MRVYSIDVKKQEHPRYVYHRCEREERGENRMDSKKDEKWRNGVPDFGVVFAKVDIT